MRGVGSGAALARRVAGLLGAEPLGERPRGDPAEWRARGLPDLSPDRYGAYLHRAWQVARASVFFEPWFAPSAANARTFAAGEIAPERLAGAHLALLRARRGQAYLQACLGDE